ncbi:MAG: HD domain-containing protein [Chloroflexi bacterium]|nr:HD domain-containing protein [Chloroflexota bacterium]
MSHSLDARSLIEFMRLAEGLKSVLRHSYTSSGRVESVAEHSWMLCLMAMLVFDSIEVEVDRLRVLKMLVVHDLPEVLTGDIPAFFKGNNGHHQIEEEAALRKMVKPLSPGLRKEILALAHEFEERKTPEARLAYAIDKAEAFIQHNIAGVESWDANDFLYQTDFDNRRHQAVLFDPFMTELKRQIDLETMDLIEQAGLMARASRDAVQRYQAGELSGGAD